MANTNIGRFVWYDLSTKDPAAAVSFYTDVTGWKTQPWEGSDYTMWVASQGPLGGVIKLGDDALRSGASPTWVGDVTVADVDASAALVKKLGGRVIVEPTDVPEVGRFSVVADPQGAKIALFKSKSEGGMAPHDRSKIGEFSWHELATSDHTKALQFYHEIFGWERIQEHDMGPMGKYLIYGRDGVTLGGMFTKPQGPMPTAWLYYIHVAELDASLARARAKGARVMNGPMEVPGGDRIAQLLDPQGAPFALQESKPAGR